MRPTFFCIFIAQITFIFLLFACHIFMYEIIQFFGNFSNLDCFCFGANYRILFFSHLIACENYVEPDADIEVQTINREINFDPSAKHSTEVTISFQQPLTGILLAYNSNHFLSNQFLVEIVSTCVFAVISGFFFREYSSFNVHPLVYCNILLSLLQI